MTPIWDKPPQGEQRRTSSRPVESDMVNRDEDGVPIDPSYVRELLPIHNVSKRDFTFKEVHYTGKDSDKILQSC